MAIKGILFDKDGTLLDFYATWEPVNHSIIEHVAEGDKALYDRLLTAGGCDPASGKISSGAPLAAGNGADIARCFHPLVPHWDLDQLTRDIDRLFNEGGVVHSAAVEGLEETLTALRADGLRLGVGTSDTEVGAHATLGKFGVIEHFDFIAGYDSGHGVKPGPGMVQGFCQATGLDAATVAVVGDNLHDIEMGRAAQAGLLVGVLTGTSLREDLEGHTDHVLNSIVELPALLSSL